MGRWPFADKPNTASITTRQALEGAPILLVTHDADDGSWQFLCGTTDNPADARVVGLGQMYKRDASLGEVADLPEGWRASRISADPYQAWGHGFGIVTERSSVQVRASGDDPLLAKQVLVPGIMRAVLRAGDWQSPGRGFDSLLGS